MVIDIYGELIFKSVDARAADIAAFDDEYSVVLAIQVFNVTDLIGSRKTAICWRHFAVHDNLGLFSQRSKKPTQSKRRTNPVAIRFDVRRDRKNVLIFN